MTTFVAMATERVALTEYRRSSTKPASRAPSTAPSVLRPYRKASEPRSVSGCRETKRARTGSVPPIRAVGTMSAARENTARTAKR